MNMVSIVELSKISVIASIQSYDNNNKVSTFNHIRQKDWNIFGSREQELKITKMSLTCEVVDIREEKTPIKLINGHKMFMINGSSPYL